LKYFSVPEDVKLPQFVDSEFGINIQLPNSNLVLNICLPLESSELYYDLSIMSDNSVMAIPAKGYSNKVTLYRTDDLHFEILRISNLTRKGLLV
jgi:hypothetical protein